MGEPSRGRALRRRWATVVHASAALLLAGVLSSCTGSSPSAARHPAGPAAATGPASDYAVTCLAVGAAANIGGPGAFRQAQQDLGPLTIRRSFDKQLPASFAKSAAAGDAAAGLHSFVSWKPPNGDHQGAAEGKYDKQITAWARSVPRTGVFATAWHEPENDMTAADFVAFERHVYTVVKAANPTIRFGPVYMAYWWDSSQPSHYIGDPQAWWPGAQYADFAGLDWYSPKPQPMTTSASFTNWYSTLEPTGVPLYITEYGQAVVKPGRAPNPTREADRAAAIEQDWSWIEAHPRIRMWMYWQASGAQGDWRITDSASEQAWRQVAESGCPASGPSGTPLPGR